MRTDTEVYARAKLIADVTGQTVGDVVEELLARQLGIPRRPRSTFDEALTKVQDADAA